MSVNMVADAKQGSRAVIRVVPQADASRRDIEDRIRERMKYYSTSYEVEWENLDGAFPISLRLWPRMWRVQGASVRRLCSYFGNDGLEPTGWAKATMA
jgi:hypothetical protein